VWATCDGYPGGSNALTLHCEERTMDTCTTLALSQSCCYGALIIIGGIASTWWSSLCANLISPIFEVEHDIKQHGQELCMWRAWGVHSPDPASRAKIIYRTTASGPTLSKRSSTRGNRDCFGWHTAISEQKLHRHSELPQPRASSDIKPIPESDRVMTQRCRVLVQTSPSAETISLAAV
jgi:hypothetical protein